MGGEENSAPTSGSTGRRFFFSICAVGVLAILSSTMSKNPVLPLFATSVGARGEMLGIIASASTIPGILFSLPAGSLSDLFGRRRVLLASGLVFATAPFLYQLVNSPWHLVAVRFYHGFATAVFMPVANASIAERFPRRRGERLSTFSSSTVVGRSVAPFLGGSILFATGSFDNLYFAVGIAGVSALLLMLALPRGLGAKKPAAPEKSETVKVSSQVRAVVGNRGILITSFVEAVQFLTFGAFEFFIVAYSESVGLAILEITVISGVQLISVVLAKPVMGRISDRYGRRKMIPLGLLLSGLPLVFVATTRSFLVLSLISVSYGLGFSTVTSSTTALVSDLATGLGYGSAIGFLSMVMDVGQASGPIITAAILASPLGFPGVFQFLAGILFVAAAVFSLQPPGIRTS